jgi:hypothetical protein
MFDVPIEIRTGHIQNVSEKFEPFLFVMEGTGRLTVNWILEKLV